MNRDPFAEAAVAHERTKKEILERGILPTGEEAVAIFDKHLAAIRYERREAEREATARLPVGPRHDWIIFAALAAAAVVLVVAMCRV